MLYSQLFTWMTRMGRPVSLASCSLMCLVGLGVWLKAVLRTSSCLALMVVLGPRLFVPPGPSSDLYLSSSGSPLTDPGKRECLVQNQIWSWWWQNRTTYASLLLFDGRVTHYKDCAESADVNDNWIFAELWGSTICTITFILINLK